MNTGVGSLSLLQGILPNQEWNQGLPSGRQILYLLSYQGSLKGCFKIELLREISICKKQNLLNSVDLTFPSKTAPKWKRTGTSENKAIN